MGPLAERKTNYESHFKNERIQDMRSREGR